MSNQEDHSIKVYNLEKRITLFAENIINFSKIIPQTLISKPLITQLIRAGTSIGANYAEADGAESNNDFIHKLGIAKKEAKETKYWLRMIITCFPNLEPNKIQLLQDETQELILILSSIINKSRKKP